MCLSTVYSTIVLELFLRGRNKRFFSLLRANKHNFSKNWKLCQISCWKVAAQTYYTVKTSVMSTVTKKFDCCLEYRTTPNTVYCIYDIFTFLRKIYGFLPLYLRKSNGFTERFFILILIHSCSLLSILKVLGVVFFAST